MKAISLWQPWASAVVRGSKRIETRSWKTNYRGPLAIHAAKRRKVTELIGFGACWAWCGALGFIMSGAKLYDRLPFGAIIGMVDLVDCRETGSFTNNELDELRGYEIYQWTERQMGDFSLGRWGWVLEHPRKLKKPIPMTGAQRLFNVPDGILLLGTYE